MKKLIIVNVGQPAKEQDEKFGGFEMWAKNAIGEQGIDIVFHDGIHDLLPPYNTIAGVIIMGSLSMVTEQKEWMLRLAKQIRELGDLNIPLLGICFGHQLIAYALGGEVGYHPKGLEIGSTPISTQPASKDDPIFSHLPNNFTAQAVHYQSVLTLPEKATLLASSDFEPHHAFRVGRCTWGVQFHPEFTTENIALSIESVKEELGQQYELKKQQVTETPDAKQVLIHFAQICRENR